jgi:polysaccharide deacetylase family protein (PEP-CTERM system associated)
MSVSILLTFDVEDWFQVENFKKHIPFSSWPECELRVEKNVHKILDLLDSIKLNNSTSPLDSINCNTAPPQNSNPQPSIVSPYAPRLSLNGKDSPCAMPYALCKSPKATFFVLGWIAKRLPHLVREIQARDHEVASHGYEHKLCRDQSGDDLKNDLVKSKKLLEDLIGNPIYGYRAPSFSIDDGILKIVEEAGYSYDSSFNSFKMNRRYGQISLTNNGNNGIYHQISEKFYELPISNLKIGNQVIPWGGGGYFRLMPLPLFKRGVEKILKKKGAYLFYLHPWEIDSDQPKVSEIARSFKFRHYLNLDKTYGKLSMLLKSFKGCRFPTCMEFLRGIHEPTPN